MGSQQSWWDRHNIGGGTEQDKCVGSRTEQDKHTDIQHKYRQSNGESLIGHKIGKRKKVNRN